jgi:hypothetical protein
MMFITSPHVLHDCTVKSCATRLWETEVQLHQASLMACGRLFKVQLHGGPVRSGQLLHDFSGAGRERSACLQATMEASMACTAAAPYAWPQCQPSQDPRVATQLYPFCGTKTE